MQVAGMTADRYGDMTLQLFHFSENGGDERRLTGADLTDDCEQRCTRHSQIDAVPQRTMNFIHQNDDNMQHTKY